MFDTSKQRVIRVIGHKNPDTDSICSAISYAYLKNQISDRVYAPRRAGEINRETAFVLQHFGVEQPRLSVDMKAVIANIDIRQEPGVDGEMSLKAAWQHMMDQNIDTLCVIDDEDNLMGLISVKDIANANMNLFDISVLSESQTSYRNLLETLDGTMLLGDPDARITRGSIRIGTSPEAIEELVQEGDIVLVTNRYEAQICAIDWGADCIVVCANATVPQRLLDRAQQSGCSVIQTHHDT